MEKIYSNALKIEREIAGIKKLGGERKKIVVHGTQNIKCFLKFQKDISTFILLREKLLQFDWLRAVVFQLNLKYLQNSLKFLDTSKEVVKSTSYFWVS